MKTYRADLHIHSCLSPCGDLDMSPRGIAEASRERGLDIIAVCDHNSAENVGAVLRAAGERGLAALAGLEINSIEEVHSLALFETEAQALAMQDYVYRNLKGTNRPELFGDQVVANEEDEVEGFNDRLLIGATQISLTHIVREVHRLGGLSIACHVDRPRYSVPSQLGFIPQDLEVDAVEISWRMTRAEAVATISGVEGRPVVRFSDAHFPADIGQAFTSLLLDRPALDEIRLAFQGRGGRRILDDS